MICPHPIPAVGAVIIEEGSLLLIRRGNEPGAGQWSIPGGRVELGEHLAEALQREVREETGLRIAVGAIADVSDLIVAEENAIAFHYVLIDYFAQVLDGDPRAGSERHRGALGTFCRSRRLRSHSQHETFVAAAWGAV